MSYAARVPEGDTIFKTARNLRTVLVGRSIVRFDAPRLIGPRPRPGTRIDAVESRGKHLLVHFADGRVLHTHLQMSGTWHLYRHGERWRQPIQRARVVLEVDDGTVAVCFLAPVVEVLTEHDTRRPAAGLDRLGPDLCDAAPDFDAVLSRLERLDPTTEIAGALLDQQVASGIGNVYKSEVLFACGVHPSTPVSALDRDMRRRLYETASRLLRANLERARRTTVPQGLAVYGRAGRPCRRCGTLIRRRRQGPGARSTYWCATCQPFAPD